MADKRMKGRADRFIPGSNIAKHREWRGLKDTWYDYCQWMKILGIMGKFITISPVRIVKGLFEYRWFGSYLAAFNMADRCLEGLQGPALRVAREQLVPIMQTATTQLGQMMKGDRRFGENDYANKMVMLEQTMSPELIAGFPGLIGMPLEAYQGLEGCYMDQNLSPHYLDVMENAGLPSDSCRLSNNAAGVAIEDDFPKIGACVIANNMPCDSSTMNSQLIDRRLGIPSMPAEIVMRWEDGNTDKYSLAMMKKTIAFIEEHTGVKFSEEAFMENVKRHNREVSCEMEKWEYMKTGYSALGATMGSLYHAFYYTFSGGTVPGIKTADKKIMAVLEKAYNEKVNCFPKSRHRAIMWGGPACYWLQFPNWLYNCWGILLVAAMDNFSGNVIIPEDSLDNALLGLAHSHQTGVMRRHLTGGWQHLVEFWEEAEKFNCDMVVLNNDITCKGALGLTGVILDQAKEKNIKLMMVSNDMFDHRTISRQDMRDEVNKFMTTVMQEEPLDASLLEFDDNTGW
ncbi:2-hydroxyacyl-CoA dehydratase family protein [Dysosmobacter sp.]|uniref:2-hydroxyacyl-CoA dehydratase family protein n=1 Tax=Dysosmobacter sp. TaxID=2591382 RepID=UPI003AB84C27